MAAAVAVERALFSVEETAARLGVSERTLWRRIRAGELPTVRIGRRVLVRVDDLDEFINARVERQGVAVP